MLEYLVWFWLALFVVALILELFTADMISIWFALAAVPSFIMALVSINPVIQIITFALVTATLLLLTRPVVKKYMKTNEIKTNVDAIVGMTGPVIKEITPDTIGKIKIRYMEWSAISNETLVVGDMARVLDVEGVKLIVEKIEK